MESYFYYINFKDKKPVYDIPEKYIFDIGSFKHVQIDRETYKHTFNLCCKKDSLDMSKLLWCRYEYKNYMAYKVKPLSHAVIFIRSNENDNEVITPYIVFIDFKGTTWFFERMDECSIFWNLKSIKFKCFTSLEDHNKYYSLEKAKLEKKRNEKKNLISSINNANIFFETPKMTIDKILVDTAYLPNVKPGDIIQGKIQMLKDGNGLFAASSKYVNYVTIYCNGDIVYKNVPMNKFQKIFIDNITIIK